LPKRNSPKLHLSKIKEVILNENKFENKFENELKK